MKKIFLTLATCAVFTFNANVFAGDASAGKAKAGMCSACHGANGISANPMWPNLKGQKAAYVSKQLKAFKSGARKDPMMAGIVAALSDADMDNLGAYFEGL
ncbi:MAG: cytochrome c [Methylococcales bacterium]|nr:cytochrome c [Methylococcales bacterium]